MQSYVHGQVVKFVASCGILLVLLLFMALNQLGDHTKTIFGRVEAVRFTPAHRVGNAWQQQVWVTKLCTSQDDGSYVTFDEPPFWDKKDSQVVIVYKRGRILGDFIVEGLQRFVPDTARDWC